MSEAVLFVRSSVCSPVRATSGAMSANAQPERFRLFSSGSVQIAASALLEMVQPERSSDSSVLMRRKLREVEIVRAVQAELLSPAKRVRSFRWSCYPGSTSSLDFPQLVGHDGVRCGLAEQLTHELSSAAKSRFTARYACPPVAWTETSMYSL